jgi:ferredoxin-like protein FixX
MVGKHNSIPERSKSMKLTSEDLSYETMTVEACGKVYTLERKRELRDKLGYCLECKGAPILCFNVTKSRINPLWTTKDPLTVEGICFEGQCLRCKPTSKDPRRPSLTMMRSSKSNQSRMDIQRDLSNGSMALSQSRRDLFRASQNRCGKDPAVAREASQGSLTSISTHSCSSRGTTGSGLPPRPSAPTPTNSASSTSRSNRSPVDLVRANSSPCHNNDTVGSDDDVENQPFPTREMQRSHSCPMQSDNKATTTHNHVTEMELPSISKPPTETSLLCTKPSSSLKDRVTDHMPPELRRDSTAGSTEPATVATVSTSCTNTDTATLPPLIHVCQSLSPSTVKHLTKLKPLQLNPAITVPTTTSTSRNHHNIHGMPSQQDDSSSGIDGMALNLKLLLEELARARDFDFLVEVLMNALQSSTKESMKLVCLDTLVSVCKQDSSNKERLVAVNAMEECVFALKNFANSKEIQQQAATAIACLTTVQKARDAVIQSGACRLLVRILQYFPEDTLVVAAAVSALRGLSIEPSTRETFELMMSSKYVSTIMATHLANAQLQRDGMAFLANISVNVETQEVSVVSRSVLKAIVDALRYHKSEAHLVKVGCFALRNLTYQHQNLRILRGIDGVFNLFDEASDGDNKVRHYQDSYDVLESLHMSQAEDESLEDQAFESLQVMVALKDGKPEAINDVWDVLTSFDWSTKVTVECLGTLASLGAESDDHKATLKGLGVRTLIDIMNSHSTTNHVMAKACSLLEVLAEDDAAMQRELMEEGAGILLLECLDRTTCLSSPGFALSALALLLSSVSTWDAKETCVRIVRETMDRHEECSMVQSCGAAVVARFGGR